MAFRRTVTVRFDEADARGILFYGRIQELAHRVYEEFVVAALVDRWEDWFLSDRFIVPIKKAEATFYRPMRPGRSYEAELIVSRMGESSFDITTRFTEPEGSGQEALCAETCVSHVFADAGRFARIPVPSEIRARLEQHLARQ